MFKNSCLRFLVFGAALLAAEFCLAQTSPMLVRAPASSIQFSPAYLEAVYLKGGFYNISQRSLIGTRLAFTVMPNTILPTLRPPARDVFVGLFPPGSYELEVTIDASGTTPAQSLGVEKFEIKAPTRVAANIPVYDWTDLWWNPSESGWGMNITMKQDRFFAVWYVYDQAGNATWYTLQAGNWASKICYTGSIIRTDGPPRGGISSSPFVPTAITVTPIGEGTMCFNGFDRAEFTYRLNGGVPAAKDLIRQAF
jgi:hypothetical protein